MQKTYPIVFSVLAIGIVVAAFLVFSKSQNRNQQTQQPAANNNPSQPNQWENIPLVRARERVIKKPFGIKVSPGNSPISLERFSGYHTGVDYEIFPGEENIDVQFSAICDGSLSIKRTATGYGGVLVESCNLNNQTVTVIYGHIKLASVKQQVGDSLAKGEVLGVLGKGYSTETDGERKHLHLGIHKGSAITLLGYVQNQTDLASWMDFEAYLKSQK